MDGWRRLPRAAGRGGGGWLPLLALVVSLSGAGCSADRGGSAGTVAGGAVAATLPPEGAGGKDSAVSVGTRGGGDGATAAGAAAPTVLIAGTSLTAGLGLDPSDAYPAVLQRLADSAGLPARVVNGGSSGETSAGLVRRMGWLLREPADVVVIETGANDGLRGIDPAQTEANLREIVATVHERAPRARVLLVQMEAPPNLGEGYTSRFRSMYAGVARESGAVLVPFLLEGVAGVASLNQADGIHPNEEGARRVARTVWGSLRPVLAEVDRQGGSR